MKVGAGQIFNFEKKCFDERTVMTALAVRRFLF